MRDTWDHWTWNRPSRRHCSTTSFTVFPLKMLKIKHTYSAPSSFTSSSMVKRKKSGEGDPSSFYLLSALSVLKRMIFPTRSHAVITKGSLCPDQVCRNTVANLAGGPDSSKFVIDVAGVHWKCGATDLLHGAMRGSKNPWMCIELDCRDHPHGLLKSLFRHDGDCGEPDTITTVDGAPVDNAPTHGREYQPVEEALHQTCVEE
ncbi:unnamed protein product [Amoebophrya sp. A25]|nr:unnamed protein product [Amoebophrya sp. A25]|eukprot:GSA25T00018585001.1